MVKPSKYRKVDTKLQAWIDARKRHQLSHAHVQMARELGLSPSSLGKLDNHHQQAWKQPLPDYIETLYEQRFGRRRPEEVLTIEQMARLRAQKDAARKQAKAEGGKAR